MLCVGHNRMMSEAIPPAIRRRIIEFDPFDGHGLSITAFCEQLKISRRTLFYNIRARYDEEAGGALHPHSIAPITPARTYEGVSSCLCLGVWFTCMV